MGQDAYATLEGKAAALLHSIVCNHALSDGNKRLGWFAAVVFLHINAYDAALTQDEAFDLTMAVASGDLRDVDAIAERLRLSARP
jgi:death-on-curing protein